MESYNRMAITRVGMEAWKAMNEDNSPLSCTMVAPATGRTRSTTKGLVQIPPPSKNAGFARHAALIWNQCEGLRVAKTEGAAKTAVTRYARTCPL